MYASLRRRAAAPPRIPRLGGSGGVGGSGLLGGGPGGSGGRIVRRIGERDGSRGRRPDMHGFSVDPATTLMNDVVVL